MHLSSLGNADLLLRKIQGFSHTEFNVWPYKSRLFLRILIFLGISYDGAEIYSFQKFECGVFDFLCKRSHKCDFFRTFVARLASPVVQYLFKRNVGRLSGPS